MEADAARYQADKTRMPILAADIAKDQASYTDATPLGIAAGLSHGYLVQARRAADAAKDRADEIVATPLCIASEPNHVDIVQALRR